MRTFVVSALLLICLSGCSRQEQQAEPDSAPQAVVDPATAGSVSGVVRFEGKVPEAATIDMSQDPGCSIGNPGPNLSQAVLVTNGNLENVYVYVKEAANGITKSTFPVPPETAIIDQKGCRYVPHVLAIMDEQKVMIRNSDSTLHNVHPTPEKNSSWNVSQMPKGEPIERVFNEPELMIPVKCNQHPWMKMFVHVSSHPFFAVTGKDGRFEIQGLPPGEYTIAALHERLGEQTVKVTVSPKGTAKADFAFKP